MGVLRLILALSVVFWHMQGHHFVIFNGGIAVVAFFIISGFYMALVINEKYSATSTSPQVWITNFYISRLLRLLPAYLVFCTVMIIVYIQSGTPNIFTPNDLTFQARFALLFFNLFMFGQDIWQTIWMHAAMNIPNNFVLASVKFFGKSASEPMYILVGQAWSLGVELIFYIVAPFIVMSKRRIVVVLMIALLCRFYFLLNIDMYPNHPWRSRLFINNIPFFLLGSISYWMYTKIYNLKYLKEISIGVAVVSVAFIVISIILFGGVLLFNGTEDYDEPRLWAFYLFFAFIVPFLFNLTKNFKIDRYLGELSYPIYLVHGLILGTVFAYGISVGAKIVISIVITFLVSTAIYLFVDRPLDTLRHKLTLTKNENFTSFRSIGFFLVFVIVSLFVIVLTRPYSKILPVPELVQVIGKYNIVKRGEEYYGIPHGVPIDWSRSDLKKINGLIIKPNKEEVIESVKNIKVQQPPILVRVVGKYNIVLFNEKYYGVPQGLIINFEKDDLTGNPNIIADENEDSVSKRILSQ